MGSLALKNQDVALKAVTVLARTWETNTRNGSPELMLDLSTWQTLVLYWDTTCSYVGLRLCDDSGCINVAFDATPLPEARVREFAAELAEKAEEWKAEEDAEFASPEEARPYGSLA